MKYINSAYAITLFAALFSLSYNTYFGWNKLPINEIEEGCDYIFKLLLVIAFSIYIVPLRKAYEKYVKENKG